MAIIKLDEKTLLTLAAPTDAAQAYFWDAELLGFGVVLGRTGVRTFVTRARMGDKMVKASSSSARWQRA
ncbi:MAG TPA: hypothetical protein VNO30_44510 [Kofleriaceae bacterium]|nr:hypothetical protein [Kofleriaceae bacterium]